MFSYSKSHHSNYIRCKLKSIIPDYSHKYYHRHRISSFFIQFVFLLLRLRKKVKIKKNTLNFTFVTYYRIFLNQWRLDDLPLLRNLRNGFTIATNRSSDIATNVKTDTPVEKSFMNSDTIHILVPHGHDSTVYTTDTNGTAVKINIKSAIDNDKICLSNEWKM